MKRAAENPPSLPSAEGLPTIDELLGLYDREFVQRAYETLLGRDPDPDGMGNYLRQVRAGVAKVRILLELATSGEGLRRAAALPGLDAAMQFEARTAQSVWARALRRLLRPSFGDVERQLRVVDNRVYLIEKTLAAQTALLEQLLSPARSTPASTSAAATDIPSHAMAPTPAAPALSYMTPPLARTFLELKAAVALKRRRGGAMPHEHTY